jgi:hypothetical protein
MCCSAVPLPPNAVLHRPRFPDELGTLSIPDRTARFTPPDVSLTGRLPVHSVC